MRHRPEERIELILDLRPTRFCGWPPAQSTRKVTNCLGSRRIQMPCVCRPFLRAFCLALLTVAAISAAGDAFAQKPSQTQINAMRQSCRSDYMAHCSSVPTGGAPALNCLKQNFANLSPGCLTAVKAIGSDSPAAAASATPPSQTVPAAPAPITSTPACTTTAPDYHHAASRRLRRSERGADAATGKTSTTGRVGGVSDIAQDDAFLGQV